MGMNPDTNELEALRKVADELTGEISLLRPNGEPVPKHWSTFKVDETVVVKSYTFRVAYINEGAIMLEPVGPVIIDPSNQGNAKAEDT